MAGFDAGPSGAFLNRMGPGMMGGGMRPQMQPQGQPQGMGMQRPRFGAMPMPRDNGAPSPMPQPQPQPGMNNLVQGPSQFHVAMPGMQPGMQPGGMGGAGINRPFETSMMGGGPQLWNMYNQLSGERGGPRFTNG